MGAAMSWDIAIIKLKTTEEGGRKSPVHVRDHYRYVVPVMFTNVPELANEYFDCWILFDNRPIPPGGSAANVPIAFLYDHYVRPWLVVGAQFTMFEGRDVGHGTLVKLGTGVRPDVE
ncbi:MAG TPA: hypothetical protein DIS79_07585 [Bacteroidetes bacterium]|nr:hypothetical protein [Bacteroidota bacterium]